MSESEQLQFPCAECPAEARERRLLGIYEQRQQGLLMQRVKVPGGRLTPGQFGTLVGLAGRYTSDYPLHVTVRQDVEFHGVRAEDLPALQSAIAGAGFTGVAACGDSLRNVTVCPRNGFCPGSVDVSPLAEAVAQAAQSLPWIRRLPRKFKISLSGCPEACARPWINDVGIIADSGGTFSVVGAGSLGARPRTGIKLYEELAAGELVPLVMAALRLFNAEGDRVARSRARLRHVRERLGDDEFRRRLDALFSEEVERNEVSPPPVPHVDGSDRTLQAWLHLPLGDIEAGPGAELAAAADRAGAELRIGLEHDLLLFGASAPALGEPLRALTQPVRVVSCPGTSWCARGIADSRATARRIREALLGMPDVFVAVSGCPNNCSHAAVAEIGLVGRLKRTGNGRTECFRLLAGGDSGRRLGLGAELHEAVPSRHVPHVVAELVSLYRDSQRREKGGFSEFVARAGAELGPHVQHVLQSRSA